MAPIHPYTLFLCTQPALQRGEGGQGQTFDILVPDFNMLQSVAFGADFKQEQVAYRFHWCV